MYVCDLHERYIDEKPNVRVLSGIATSIFVLIAVAMVPVYAQSDSIINLLQELWGLISMPIWPALLWVCCLRMWTIARLLRQ